MTEAERRVLEKMPRYSRQRRVIACGCGGTAGFMAGVIVAGTAGAAAGLFMILAVSFAYLGALGGLHLVDNDERIVRARQRDLLAGEVIEMRVRVKDAIAVMRLDNNPGIHLLLLDNGQTLTLQNDKVDHMASESDTHEACFPNTDIVLIKAPQSGHVLKVKCLGDYLEPAGFLDAPPPIPHPRDGQLLDINFDDLKRDIHFPREANADESR
jgi:hypothetical protein